VNEGNILDFISWSEGKIGCKVLSLVKMMTLAKEEIPANFVPAAAVIRRG